MCVIILVNKGKKLSNLLIQQAAKANDDGFGVAWVQNGVVNLKKSMKLDDVLPEIHDSRYRRLIHFRIATHGTTSESNCHPFWLETRPRCAIAHNGTWTQFGESKPFGYNYLYNQLDGDKEGKELKSDTAEAVDYLNKLIKSYKINKLTHGMMNFLHKSLGSKAAILTPQNVFHLWGGFTEIKPGILASNTHWYYPKIQPKVESVVVPLTTTANTTTNTPSTENTTSENTTPAPSSSPLPIKLPAVLSEANAKVISVPMQFNMAEIYAYLTWLREKYTLDWHDFPIWSVAKLLAKAIGTETKYLFSYHTASKIKPSYVDELCKTLSDRATEIDFPNKKMTELPPAHFVELD